jgi:hypothetical protein
VVADLGGGGGSLILAVLALNPHLRGMLVDLESSVDAAKSRFAEEDPSSRCELIAADLTQSVPAGADVYMIKHVLHGRQDADAITILKNCRAVIPQNGSLLIIEFILPALVSHADPQLEGHLMSDLNMLAVTGGKERSEREWRTLLEAAGFILTGVYPVGGDNLMVRNVGIWKQNRLRAYKKVVKMTFAKGASLDDPSGLFNSSLEGRVRRAIDFREGDKVNEKALKGLIRAAVELNASLVSGR